MRSGAEGSESSGGAFAANERPSSSEGQGQPGRSLGLAAFAAQIAPPERFDGYAVAAHPLIFPVAKPRRGPLFSPLTRGEDRMASCDYPLVELETAKPADGELGAGQFTSGPIKVFIDDRDKKRIAKP